MFFSSQRVLHNKKRPTKRALDGWDSAPFSGIFHTRTESCSRSFIHARPPASNANRWALRGKPNARANANANPQFVKRGKITVMENETNTNNEFNIENCRAENVVKSWVDCLSLEQASFCGFSVKDGNGYSCEHPRRFAIVEMTRKLQDKSISPSNVLWLDNQE